MLEILQKILIGLFGCALIFFPIAYRMMDKIRFHGQMCVRQMDDGLARWLETAAEMLALGGEGDEAARYARLTEAFRCTKRQRTDEKVRLVNEAYELVRTAALRCYGEPRAQALAGELAGICAEFSMLSGDYNENARKLNEQLSGGSVWLFGKLFRIRPQPVLAPLNELKC